MFAMDEGGAVPAELSGDHPDHPVARVLRERRDSGSRPGQRQDPYRVVLAVEGGGMRGIISGAMLTALADMGLQQSFDAVYALSAGAINVTYFIAGSTWQALSVYYDDLVGRSFYNPRRMLSGKPVVSIPYVFDEAMDRSNPLDYESALASPIELHVITTSVDRVAPRVLARFASVDELRTALRASVCLPFAAGPPVDWQGDLLLDGGILTRHPIIPALADGCTHLVLIRTRADRVLPAEAGTAQRLTARGLDRYRKGLGAAYLRTVADHRLLFPNLLAKARDRAADPYILDLHCPFGSHRVSRFTQDRGLLYEGLRVAYRSTFASIAGSRPYIHLRPTTVDFPATGPEMP